MDPESIVAITLEFIFSYLFLFLESPRTLLPWGIFIFQSTVGATAPPDSSKKKNNPVVTSLLEGASDFVKPVVTTILQAFTSL